MCPEGLKGVVGMRCRGACVVAPVDGRLLSSAQSSSVNRAFAGSLRGFKPYQP
jgi:hypothetical protein